MAQWFVPPIVIPAALVALIVAAVIFQNFAPWGAAHRGYLDNADVSGGEPKLIVRKASYAPIWSVWAVRRRRKSSKGLQRKMRQAGSIPADDHGLKNGGENALPSAPMR